VNSPLGHDLAALLEQLAELVAGKVAERLVEHQAVSSSAHPPWMGVDKAADYLDWPRQRLYKLTASGEIPHYKHEGRLLFRRDELDRWLERFGGSHNLLGDASS